MHNTFTLPNKTYIDLNQPDIYQRFMKEYLELLRSKLQQSKVMDQKGDLLEIRYSCVRIMTLEILPGNPFSIWSYTVVNRDTMTWRRWILLKNRLADGWNVSASCWVDSGWDLWA